MSCSHTHAEYRSDVDDAAAAFFRNEAACSLLRHIPCRREVGRHGGVECCGIGFEEEGGLGNAGIIEDEIGCPEPRCDVIEGARDGSAIGDIECYGHGFAALGANAGGEICETIRTSRGQRDTRSCAREGEGECLTDTARRAGHQGDSAIESECSAGIHAGNDTVRAMSVLTPEQQSAFIPSGVITLTSDFGLRDPFVGVMKGRILSAAPMARVIDLTHEILAHWPAEAGFWLARSYRYFPVGTVHVAVVDPGVGTARDIAMVAAEGHLFLAPDNGLLADVVEQTANAQLWHLGPQGFASLGISKPSATFHGRDIFAPAAAALATHKTSPEALGERVDSLVPGWVDEATTTRDRVSGVVITIDHFGNLITNIAQSSCAGFVDPVVHAGKLALPLRRTYGDVTPGDPVALINSFGVIEIAVAERRAADALGLSRGAPITVRDGVRRI